MSKGMLIYALLEMAAWLLLFAIPFTVLLGLYFWGVIERRRSSKTSPSKEGDETA